MVGRRRLGADCVPYTAPICRTTWHRETGITRGSQRDRYQRLHFGSLLLWAIHLAGDAPYRRSVIRLTQRTVEIVTGLGARDGRVEPDDGVFLAGI